MNLHGLVGHAVRYTRAAGLAVALMLGPTANTVSGWAAGDDPVAAWESFIEETQRYWQLVVGRAVIEVDYLGGIIHVAADAFDEQEARAELRTGARAIVGGTGLWRDLERSPATVQAALASLDRHAPESFPTRDGWRAEQMIYLVREHMTLRAERLVQTVRRECEDRGLPTNMVLALVEAESMFNPLAFSADGAIGLMQLHPETQGRFAVERLGLGERAPTRDELEDPQRNIALGCAYLGYLVNEEFEYVEDVEARRMTALAAFGWGVLNVHKRLNVDRDMTSSQFDYRLAAAPPRTRAFVRRILKRRERYQGL